MPPGLVDATDRAIVSRLQVDGRIANVDLADAVSLSPSACLRRVRALEQDGIIAGYRADIDRVRAGLGLTAFIELTVERHSRENSQRLERELMSISAVVACYIISGRANMLVEVAVPDLAAYERVLIDQILTIDTITGAHSTFAIRSVRSRGPLPLDHWR
jgi:Lrp/AsnC family transcriptional regulator, leucine-responsive regulatory protein